MEKRLGNDEKRHIARTHAIQTLTFFTELVNMVESRLGQSVCAVRVLIGELFLVFNGSGIGALRRWHLFCCRK